ncbi:phage tail tube protein [Tissierella pigra]|jgi:hypothetical protein|uniref:Terminase n=1 Tax=Tissierella pigra TaxID=2607614 RepID=A0A6N7Y2W7_9FIRM|nr:phage tail tube protein [Tissierella pigra]MBU5427157.1 phage tail tube protein [Tissierella pigra]MSU03214.1 hypothetical protein [Tissierella pigra]
MSKGNQYWNGSNGNIWVNDSEWDKVKSFEVKMVIEWEDVPNGMTTDRVLLGYGYEGSFSYRKSDKNYNKAIDLLFAEYVAGRVPDVTIIGKAFNRATGKTQRIKVTNITFDELALQSWEEKSVGEVEMPFKASEVEILQ